MMSLTPLMAAASDGQRAAGGAPRRARARGSTRWTSSGGCRFISPFAAPSASPAFAREKLGALYELLCPTGLDLESRGAADASVAQPGRVLRPLGDARALPPLYGRFGHATARLRARQCSRTRRSAAFPRSVIREERRKRTYWNAVLARAEEGSRPTARRVGCGAVSATATTCRAREPACAPWTTAAKRRFGPSPSFSAWPCSTSWDGAAADVRRRKVPCLVVRAKRRGSGRGSRRTACASGAAVVEERRAGGGGRARVTGRADTSVGPV